MSNTISEYLEELVSQKSALAANLTTMGVSASSSEKLNTLVPKVLEIEGDEPVIQSLSVTQNGTYTPPSGVDGYAPVTVNVLGQNLMKLSRYTKAADPSGSFTVSLDASTNTIILNGTVRNTYDSAYWSIPADVADVFDGCILRCEPGNDAENVGLFLMSADNKVLSIVNYNAPNSKIANTAPIDRKSTTGAVRFTVISYAIRTFNNVHIPIKVTGA